MEYMFTNEYTWNGGLYELSFELLERSDEAIKQALAAVWQTPYLDGCYMRNDIEPHVQMRITPWEAPTDGHVYGIATLPNGQRSACGSYIADFGIDGVWVSLYLPLGALSTVYPAGAYPFGASYTPSPEPWLRAVNEWLKDIAEAAYSHAPFTIAFIGFELPYTDLKEQALVTMPAERWDGILLPQGDHIHWYPPTIYAPQFT